MPTPFVPTLAYENLRDHPQFRHLSTVEGIRIDLRYASANNFVGRDLYAPMDCAWMHAHAAEALALSAAWLAANAQGAQLLVLDALRPQRIQQTLWNALAGTDLQMYLAEPGLGSIHSFGMALDVTLCTDEGTEMDMGTGFDAMEHASHPAHEAVLLASGRLSAEHLHNRDLLRSAMAVGGYQGISTEWWHFDYGDRKTVRAQYPRVL